MGMLVTLYLCSVNVYATIDAPKNRGFSYIDLWMIGTQLPILMALLEFGSLLCILKYDLMSYFESRVSSYQPEKKPEGNNPAIAFVRVSASPTDQEKFKLLARRIDFVFFVIGSTYFFIFTLVYWCTLS